MQKLPNYIRKLLILLFWLALWQLVSSAIHNRILIVGPKETLEALASQVSSSVFWEAIWFSFARIGTGFFLAFFTGLVTGAVSFRFPAFGELLEPAMQFMKAIPVASFVILALIWTGSRNLSVFISFMVVYPMIHINTLAGLSSTETELLEMARVFRVPLRKKALYIYRTALYPYLASACRTALGMGFKSGIAAEVIGVPDGSVGEGLYMAKIYLSTAELFAWTLAIIGVSMIFEKAFLLLLKAAAGKGCMTEHAHEHKQ